MRTENKERGMWTGNRYTKHPSIVGGMQMIPHYFSLVFERIKQLCVHAPVGA